MRMKSEAMTGTTSVPVSRCQLAFFDVIPSPLTMKGTLNEEVVPVSAPVKEEMEIEGPHF
jgi:hypothetical protein